MKGGSGRKGGKRSLSCVPLYKYLIWPINNQPYASIADLPNPVLPHCPSANIPNVSVVTYLILSLYKSTRSLSTTRIHCLFLNPCLFTHLRPVRIVSPWESLLVACGPCRRPIVSPSNPCRRPIVTRDPQYTFHCLILARNHPL